MQYKCDVFDSIDDAKTVFVFLKMEDYKEEYVTFLKQSKSAFRCLGFLLKHYEYVGRVTLTDVVELGASMSEEELYWLAQRAFEYPPPRLMSVIPFTKEAGEKY